MARRGENIFKRKDGRWEARYVSGKNEFGKTRYASVYGKSYREVKEKREKQAAGKNSRRGLNLQSIHLEKYWICGFPGRG